MAVRKQQGITMKDKRNGFAFVRPGSALFSAQRSAGAAVRGIVGRAVMSWLYWIVGLIALGLLVYLALALLKPEWFG
jgi:K+-transporting ATPase KdpF subunit